MAAPKEVGMFESKTRLSELVQRVLRGERFYITRMANGWPSLCYLSILGAGLSTLAIQLVIKKPIKRKRPRFRF